MSSLLERRYRRVLRLLPAGYRHRWEEDMVGAFMAGAHASDSHADDVMSGRPALAERLSVVALAVRVRLNGSYATPRGLVWYHVVHGLALMILLYQAFAATISVAFGVRDVVESTVDGRGAELQRPLILEFFSWSEVFSLLWVAAFCCFVLGRLMAARVLVVLALASTIGVTVTTHIIVSSAGVAGVPFGPADLSRWGWLAVSVATVFACPPDARASQRFWFGAYLVGSLALVLIALQGFTPYGPWVRLVNLTNATSAALIIAMAVALLGVLSGRHQSPCWLLTLAAFAGGVGGIRLMTTLAREPWPMGAPPYAGVATSLDAILVSLAVACAVVGLFALRRLPGASLSSGALVRDPRSVRLW
jgi:hypothetical protein